jgi:serine/threonine-protein kinase
MGVVYKARQVGLGRTVALKMIRHAEHAGEDERRRFQAEAEAVASLQHPHIVQIHEVGEHGGLPYFSLEFCPGGSLEKQLDGTPWEGQRAAALVGPLARAMHAAHRKGLVHRDLKPANVLLAEDGTPKITDFGLAKRLDLPGQTQTGAVVGTPSYMAPEQARGRRAVGPTALLVIVRTMEEVGLDRKFRRSTAGGHSAAFLRPACLVDRAVVDDLYEEDKADGGE